MKIISRKQLAVNLSEGKVNIELISKRLEKAVNLWLSRKEVVIENGYMSLT